MEIFRKSKILKIFDIRRKFIFDQISKSIFDQKFSIFFHELFLTAKESSGESKREG